MEPGTRWYEKMSLWSPTAAFVLRWAIILLILDQASKYAILYGLGLRQGQKIILTQNIDILMVWNRGISYGLLQQDSDFGRWLLVVVGLAACVSIWIWSNRAQTKWFCIGAALVIGGGLGNTIDRVIYGAVADFVSLHAFNFYWYVFNVADVAIVAGFALLLYDMIWPGSSPQEPDGS